MMASDSDKDSESSENDNKLIKIENDKPTLPIKTSDLALSKSSFQQMLMNYNNRVVSNDKHNFINTPKSILKKSRSSVDLHDFNPPLSSTQNINLSSDWKLLETPSISDTKKHKKKKKHNQTLEEGIEQPKRIKRKHQQSESDVSESQSFEETFQNLKKVKREIINKGSLFLDDSKIKSELNQSFEQDEVPLKASSKLDSVLNKFESDNHLTRSEDIPGFSKDITSNRYETFLVQIPKAFEPGNLIGFELSLDKKVRIKYDGIKYDCIPTNCEKPATFLNNNCLNIIQPRATLIVKQHIKQGALPAVSSITNNSVPFPNNLKERHPLFGADYETIIMLEESIRNKLKAAIESSQRRKKKELKKIDESKEMSGPPQEEEIFKLLNQSVGKKHKKSKRKNSDEEKHELEGNDDIINQILLSKSLEISGGSGKKKKHKELIC